MQRATLTKKVSTFMMSIFNALGLWPYAKLNDSEAESYAVQLLQKISRGDYKNVGSLLQQSSDQNCERMIYGFATAKNSVPLSTQWVVAEPNSAFANVLLGASFIVSGWKIRGSSYAEDVDSSAWAPFLNSLANSEEPLYRAMQLDQSIAEPYSWLIHAGLGNDASREALYQLFLEATSRVPTHWPSHYKYFTALTEKWGGSHVEMFDFVRSRVQLAPPASMLHCLIPSAYNEYALAELGTEKAKAVLGASQAAQEVTAALYAWSDATPGSLSRKLSRLSGGFAGYGLNHFAVALYLCGVKKETKAVLEALGGEIQSVPWTWIAKGFKERINPAFVYDRVCKECRITPAQ